MEQEQELVAINQPGEMVTTRSPFLEDDPPKWYTRHLKNLAFTLSIIFAIYLYQSGLTKCPYKQEIKCSKEYLLPRLPKLIRNDLLSIIIYATIVVLYKLKKTHGLFVCVIPVILTYQLFLTSHQMTEVYYKLLYQIIYGTLIFFSCLIALISYAVVKLFKRFRYIFLIGMIVVIIFIYVYGKHYVMKSCNEWKLGLMDKQVGEGTCKVIEPEYCWYDFLDGYQDFSQYYNKCSPNYYNKQRYLKKMKEYKEISHSVNYVAYPRTEKVIINYNKFDEKHLYMSGKEYQQYFLENTQFLPDLNLPEDNEVYLDLNSFQIQYNKIIYSMNIKRNETLVQERQGFAEESKTEKKRPKNIITIWVDAVSRPRFMKKLHKSTERMQQISEENDRILFQGFKYTAIAGFTSPNLKAYEYGYVNVTKKDENKSWVNTLKTHDKYESLSKQLKKMGYIIGKARAQCNSQILETDKHDKKILEPNYADHEMVGISCDIMSQSLNGAYSITDGPYSIFRRCINDKDQHDFVIDYAKQFLTTYQDEPKYLELYFIDGHEGTGEVINYLDDPLDEFFDFLSKNNHDEESVIILLSDHGLHMQGLSYLLGWKIFEIERALPGMFILADKSLLSNEDQNNLYKNEQNTISILDLRYFIQYLIGEDEQFYKQNSLISPNLNRTCKDIPMADGDYCPCG